MEQAEIFSPPFEFPNGNILVAAKNGDGDERHLFKVSSNALCLASPVWNKLISYTSAQLGNDVRIEFTGDDTDAVLLLLYIAHLQFDKVPVELGYKTLLQVAVLCDRYDCVALIRPWLESWMKNEMAEALKKDQENWLFIAWVFGRLTVFEELSRRLVLDVTVTDGGCFVNGHKIEDPMPPDILDAIFQTRVAVITKLLDLTSVHFGKESCKIGQARSSSVAPSSNPSTLSKATTSSFGAPSPTPLNATSNSGVPNSALGNATTSIWAAPPSSSTPSAPYNFGKSPWTTPAAAKKVSTVPPSTSSATPTKIFGAAFTTPATSHPSTTLGQSPSPGLPSVIANFLADERKKCKALTCGSIITGLAEHGLWPTPSAAQYAMSVQTLRSQISSLKVYSLGTAESVFNASGSFSHDLCNSHDFKAAASRIVAELTSPVLESHIQHMQAAARK